MELSWKPDRECIGWLFPFAAKCGGQRFELADIELPGGTAKFKLIQCSNCGVAIGAVGPDGTDQIEGLRRQIAPINLRLMQIAKVLAGLN